MTQYNAHDGADTLPPQAALTQMLYGPLIQQCICVAAKLGIADLLAEKPQTAEDLASRIGAHAPSLYRLLRALASLGLFAENPDHAFEITPIAALLRCDTPNSMRDFAIFMGEDWLWRVFNEMLHSVKTGSTACKKVHGLEVWEFLARNPEPAEVFNRAMTSFSLMAVPPILESYDFSEVSTLVDIGGGQGILLAGILKENPRLKGVLFDLPSVIEKGGELLEKEGLADRVELVSGDFFQSVPEGADIYMMKLIIHDWDDECSVAILQNIGSAITEHGKVLIIERVIPEGNEPSLSKIQDIEMMIGPAGKERTEDEYRTLLERSGFRMTRVIPTQSPLSVIEGERV